MITKLLNDLYLIIYVEEQGDINYYGLKSLSKQIIMGYSDKSNLLVGFDLQVGEVFEKTDKGIKSKGLEDGRYKLLAMGYDKIGANCMLKKMSDGSIFLFKDRKKVLSKIACFSVFEKNDQLIRTSYKMI